MSGIGAGFNREQDELAVRHVIFAGKVHVGISALPVGTVLAARCIE